MQRALGQRRRARTARALAAAALLFLPLYIPGDGAVVPLGGDGLGVVVVLPPPPQVPPVR